MDLPPRYRRHRSRPPAAGSGDPRGVAVQRRQTAVVGSSLSACRCRSLPSNCLELGGLPSAATRRHRLRDASAMRRRSVRRIFLGEDVKRGCRRRHPRILGSNSMNLQESSIRWSVEPSPSSSHVLPHSSCRHARVCNPSTELPSSPIAANQLTALGCSSGHEPTQGACRPARATCCRTVGPAINMTAHCRLSCLMTARPTTGKP